MSHNPPFEGIKFTPKKDEFLTFPGGEPHVKLQPWYSGKKLIDARVRNFNDLGKVLVETDALKRMGVKVSLRLPYFPGARQDRASKGEALTVKVYADIINSMGYESVEILDPHSDVTPALVNNVRLLYPTKFLRDFIKTHGITHLVSPDAGAAKKVEGYAKEFSLSHNGIIPVLHCRKERDTKTGKLSGFKIEPPQVDGNYLIIDDICDGGGTFEGLAEEFYNYTEDHYMKVKLFLFVSHGIFSKGLGELLNWFSWIGTTDSFYSGAAYPRLSIYKVSEL